jgi:hypothetical protein
VGVTLNGQDSSFFKTGKGLRQGDPLSPLLYNLAGDVLTKMLIKATNLNMIRGLSANSRTQVISLHYADDTILFSDIDPTHLQNLRCTLAIFEQISGMRINFHKSELIPLNLEDHQSHQISHMFSCPVGVFPIKYLGVPRHYEKLQREDIQPLVDKILNRISGWRGKLLPMQPELPLSKPALPQFLCTCYPSLNFPNGKSK